MSWTGPKPEAVYQVCDTIKIIGLARTLEDNLALSAFVEKKTATPAPNRSSRSTWASLASSPAR